MVEKNCRVAKKSYERNLNFFWCEKKIFSVNHNEKFFFSNFFSFWKSQVYIPFEKLTKKNLEKILSVGCGRWQNKLWTKFWLFLQIAAETNPVTTCSWNSTHSFHWSICLKSHRCCIKVWKKLGAQCSCLGKSFC